MIFHLKGTVEFIHFDGTISVEPVSGFGVQVNTVKTYMLGDKVDLWIYMMLKEVESKMDLKFYGFDSIIMIDDFERLMSINGVGPKMAFTLIKSIPQEKLVEYVRNGDYAEIKKIPGVGDKLAKRIVLELSRVFSVDDDVLAKMQESTLSKDQKEVLNTLITMGFDKESIIEGFKNIDSGLNKKDILRDVLTYITKKK